MEADQQALQAAAREMLALLWEKAIANEVSSREVEAIQKACVAIAIAEYGRDRIFPAGTWDGQ